ncbi:hypothetical protein KAR91_70325, partial [Candidatus Pacearchaeota archaeon]|nr:hypothetical protein [Candidatus Pacearchaeota archaeon]
VKDLNRFLEKLNGDFVIGQRVILSRPDGENNEFKINGSIESIKQDLLETGSIREEHVDILAQKISQAIATIRDDIGAEERIDLTITKSITVHTNDRTHTYTGEYKDGIPQALQDEFPVTYKYRVKEDLLNRDFIFITSDQEANIVINTEFIGQDVRKAYEFSSLGERCEINTNRERVKQEEFFGRLAERVGAKNGADIEKELLRNEAETKKDEIGMYSQSTFVEIEKNRIITGADGEEFLVPVETRYLGLDDPYARDYVTIVDGDIRFMKYEETVNVGGRTVQIPFGVSSGEISYRPEIARVVRITEYREHNRELNEHIYSVPYEYRDGQELKNKNILVGYNYKTGIVWEHYVDEEWKLYSRDGIPLYITRIEGVNGGRSIKQGFDYKEIMKGSTEKLYSEFEIKADKQGDHTYLLISEEIQSPTKLTEPVQRIIKDGKLWAIVDGDFIRTNVYKVGFKDKYLNSIPGWIFHGLIKGTRFESNDGEDIAERLELLEDKGISVDLKYEIPEDTKNNVFIDTERQILGLFKYASLVFVVFIFIVDIYARLRKGKSKKNLNYATSARLHKLLGKVKAEKIILLRELSGPFVVSKLIQFKSTKDKKERKRKE